jgi:hypothetical protein
MPFSAGFPGTERCDPPYSATRSFRTETLQGYSDIILVESLTGDDTMRSDVDHIATIVPVCVYYFRKMAAICRMNPNPLFLASSLFIPGKSCLALPSQWKV